MPVCERILPSMVMGSLVAPAARHLPRSCADLELTAASTLVMSASPFSMVATSFTESWLAHEPQPMAHAESSPTAFLSRPYSSLNSCSSQSAPSVRRHSTTWSPRSVLRSRLAHEL